MAYKGDIMVLMFLAVLIWIGIAVNDHEKKLLLEIAKRDYPELFKGSK